MQHLLVRKLTRRELEDKYLRLIDESYDLKRENNVQKEKIKIITTKLLRLNKENSKIKSREFLFMDENNEIQEAEEFFSSVRPRAVSARLCKDVTRNSTPNLNAKKNDDLFYREIIDFKNRRMSGGGNEINNSNHNLGAKNMEQKPTSSRLSEMEEEILNLNKEIQKLQQDEKLEKKTNFQLKEEINFLKEKLSNKEIEKELGENVEVIALKRKIIDLQNELDKAALVNLKNLKESKSEQETLSELLENETQKIKKYEAQSNDLFAAKKMMENLENRAAIVEKEKADLINQIEKYSKMSEDFNSYKMKMTELTQKLDFKEKELIKERTDKDSIVHSQDDLLKKMKELQKENDILVVKLEGLKTENDGLINKNKKLEDRVKNLEDQNKQQLIKINETLKLPVPAPKDQETVKLRVEQDVRRIEKIRDKTLSAPNDTSQKVDSETSILDKKESLMNLTKRSSIDKSEVSFQESKEHSLEFKSPPPEIRQHSQVKVLTINDDNAQSDLFDISKERELNNANYSNIQVPISRDSEASSSKAFQITFSKSVSKEIPSVDDEEFDQNTFSVEQVKMLNLVSTSDNAIEKAKNILVDQVMNQNERSSFQMKHVKMSIDSLIKDGNRGWSNLVITKRDSKSSKICVKELINKKSTEESLYHPSFQNTRKTLSQLPRYVLDNIQTDDSNFTVKYGINYISIEIVSLQLIPNTNFICDDLIRKLYVEYSFLGYKGHLLETPQSLFKSKKANEIMYYRFHKKFELKSDENEKQLKLLKEMLEKNSKKPLRLLLISEPIDDNDECEEVGFSTINLGDVIKKSKIDSEKLTANVYSTSYPHELIALLTVTIEGILFMKELLRDM
ncbi:unnamed protein product [Diamesa serratosioi]